MDEPDASGNLTVNTCYYQDALNNLRSVYQDIQTLGWVPHRYYNYDALSRLTAVTLPELGPSGSPTGTVSFYYTTSAGAQCSGNPSAVCRRTDSRNITTTYAYDALNRLTGITYSDGTTPAVSYFYDQTGYNGLTITNGKGRRTGMSDGSGATAWSYDAAGRVLIEQRTIAGVTKTISYSYNLDSSLASVTYPNPSSHVVTYQKGNAQRSLWAKDLGNNVQYAVSATYAPTGALSSAIYGQATGFNGITESRSYNNRLEYNIIQATSSAGIALNLAYCYNPFSFATGCSATPTNNNAQITGITNNSVTGRSQGFAYDNLDRIASATSQASSGSDCWGQGFGPDVRANLNTISSTQPCPVGTLSVTVNAKNRITETGYGYDNAGNMTQDGIGYTYSFDAENRLVQASGMTGGPYCYIYDGNGLRVAKKANAPTCDQGTIAIIYWRSIAGDTLAETDSSGNTTNAAYNEYVFFAGRRIARRTGPGSVFYYFADHLGTTRRITDALGNVCYDAEFTPYGQEMQKTNTCPQNYKFTGYERDSETGLDYAFARYYSSRLGRFLSPDPVGGSILDPQSINLYSYVRNSPTALVDPLGLLPQNDPRDRDPRRDPYQTDAIWARFNCWRSNFGCSGAPWEPVCYVNGFQSSCSWAFSLIQRGLAAVCRFGDCRNVWFTDEGWKGWILSSFVRAIYTNDVLTFWRQYWFFKQIDLGPASEDPFGDPSVWLRDYERRAQEGGRAIRTLVEGFELIATPLHNTALSAAFFIGSGTLFFAGGAVIAAGCAPPHGLLTCGASIYGGVVGGFAPGAVLAYAGYWWTANQTIPSYRKLFSGR